MTNTITCTTTGIEVKSTEIKSNKVSYSFKYTLENIRVLYTDEAIYSLLSEEQKLQMFLLVAETLNKKYPIGSTLDIYQPQNSVVVKSEFVPRIKDKKILFLCDRSEDETDFYYIHFDSWSTIVPDLFEGK